MVTCGATERSRGICSGPSGESDLPRFSSSSLTICYAVRVRVLRRQIVGGRESHRRSGHEERNPLLYPQTVCHGFQDHNSSSLSTCPTWAPPFDNMLPLRTTRPHQCSTTADFLTLKPVDTTHNTIPSLSVRPLVTSRFSSDMLRPRPTVSM